jgi:hypothetical protein
MESKTQNKAVDQKRSAGDYKLLKSPTGIKGFDDITFGGLPLNRPTLLVGSIGSGKTFLAMEYIINGIEMFNEPGVFMTFEEKTDELLENISSLGYDINRFIENKTIYLEHLEIGSNFSKEVGTYKIDGFTSVVLSRLLASTTAKIYFYPAETSSISRTLTGQRAVAGYGNPNIVKSDKVVLSSKAVNALRGR